MQNTVKQTAANNLFIYAANKLFNNRLAAKIARLINAGAELDARALAATHGHRWPETGIFHHPFAKVGHTHQLDSNLPALQATAAGYRAAVVTGAPELAEWSVALRKAIQRDAKGQAVFHS